MHLALFDSNPLLAQLRQVIAGRLGLDCLDALELALDVEAKFGISLGRAAVTHTAITSRASLADFIRHHSPQRPVAA